MDFYKEALGLTGVRRIENPDFTIVYLGDGVTGFQLELTWLKDRKQPYNLGDNEFHTAFAVKDMDAALAKHKEMAASSTRIRPWASTSSSIPTATGWKSFRSVADEERIYQRTARLIGQDKVDELNTKKVLVFGVGGVGSAVVEALGRAGVGHLILVDADVFDPSNLNRQLGATVETIGRPKVEVMKERLLTINPDIDVETHATFYLPESHEASSLNPVPTTSSMPSTRRVLRSPS